MTTFVVKNSVFRGFFEKQKLTGPNFIDWYRQLRIVLSVDDKLDYLEQPIPLAHVSAQSGQQVALEALAAHVAWVKGSKEIVRLMLMTMEPDIQRNLENLSAYGMLQELKTLFAQQVEWELLQTMRDFHSCKQKEGYTVLRDGIFKIDLSNSNTNDSSMYAVSNKRAKLYLDSALLWHCRLGHISKKRIEKLQHDGLLNSTDLRAFKKCVSCMSGKMAQKPYTHQVKRTKDLLGLIHTDVCGLFRIVSRQGASYFITFTNDFSRYGYIYLLKHKHEVFETFRVFQKEVENQLGKTIKSLRSDRGSEYMSQESLDHLKEHGIIAHRTHRYTPQHNDVSERRNRTLLDMVRSMMSQTTLPKSFWDYAFETVARILSMVPTKKVEKTPYEVWHISIKCIFVGYLKETMGYSFYYPPENKVLVPLNAEFLENSLITQEASGSLEDLEIIQEEDTHPSIDSSLDHEEDDLEIDESQSDIISIRMSTRTRHAPDPALLDPDSGKCLNAMNVQMQFMKDNEVWDLADIPPNGKTVGSKWLFKKKTDMDGAIHIFKAHLVVKGFTQMYRFDYEETFSLVANIKAIRILIAIAAYYDYEIWQMNVKIIFLNGQLSEENKRFDDEIKKYGFTQNRDELCVVLKASESNVTFLILYVDDILIMGNNIPMLQDVKSYLGRCFAMKDLSEVAYIIGIKIYRDRSRRLISLCQSAYVEKILKRFHIENSKRGNADDLKSQNGYVFILNGGVVDLKSTKQSIFATSSAEAKYIAAYDASKEVVWVRKFISGLGITNGARHFRAKVHYLHEVIEYGDIKLEKVHTDDNLVDPFTKALAFPKHSKHTRNIIMLPANSLM
uniref:Integrase catalytic domain-containing protein n=1 Tax=Tanacetum cinerariifolium TaxID=118510 RepID=A0A699HGE6_TANCI|nr:hypothetical protein [Tanacetum cinerariifolium]